ncbi:MAG: hypothetical protein NTY35_10785 [Planctomycetota bacterium]|nr:hypothetical protein [Planctomycetota bacterium]
MRSRPILTVLTLLAGLLVAGSARAQEPLDSYAKVVAAPPADIRSGTVVLPAPEQTGVSSPVQIRAVETSWTPGSGWALETGVAVDADGELNVVLLTPRAVNWTWEFVDEAGTTLDLDRASRRGEARRDSRDGLEDAAGWSADRWDLSAVRVGSWRIRARAEGLPSSTPPPSGWLVARTAGSARLALHVSTLELRSDVELGVVARFEDAAPIARATGVAVVELATGSVSLPLLDDGRHADGRAGDGVFGALLPRWTSGPVRARVDLTGTTIDGATIARTAQISFPVIERRAALTGGVSARLSADGRVRIDLEALPLGPPAKLHVSTEVWGTSAEGRLVPVCWLSRMLEPVERTGLQDLPLLLDTRWIELAGASAPFVLRRVRVQDPDTDVPHDLADEIAFDMPIFPVVGATLVTQSMLQGPGGSAVPVGPRTQAGPVLLRPALALVHGYCSGGSIWPAAHFTQPKLEFLDPNANRTHDQFALLLRQATSAQTSFGVVAHSQGGMAALHLLTYYASGLDHATGPRLIQSVGSPYQGTPLASLGFFACGVNNDMTTGGAPIWLAGIPTWARSKVYYWTTQNSGSACSALANLWLGQPNDGTTERDRGQLPGANSMGHITGWCHTTGMSNPASYTDATLNAERNAQAAR